MASTDMRAAKLFLVSCIAASAVFVGMALGNLGINIGQPLSFWTFILIVNGVSLAIGFLFQAYLIWKGDAPRS